MKTNFILLTATLFSLAACTSSEFDDSLHNGPPLTVVTDSDRLTPESIVSRMLLPSPTAFVGDRTQSEIIRTDHGAAVRTLGNAIPGLREATVEQMDVMVAEHARQVAEEYRWAVENIFAQFILDSMHERSLGREHLDIIDRQVRVLVSTESQRADLIAPSLALLSETWSDEELRVAADAAVKAAESWMGAVAASELRRSNEYGAQAVATAVRQDIADGVESLRAFSK